MVSSHSLAGTHLAVFAHLSITPIISNVQSECIATGINNSVGNKGAVSIRFCIGKTRVLFISSHLASGQHKVDRRNQDFMAIHRKFVMKAEGDDGDEGNSPSFCFGSGAVKKGSIT